MTKHRLSIPDNCINGKQIKDCIETEGSLDDNALQETCNDIAKFGGKNINKLVAQNDKLLVFPKELDYYEDGIGQQQICSLSTEPYTLYTGNVIGYVGSGNTLMHIGSRFDHDKKEYFLHYMLQKVFCPHLVDFQYTSTSEPIFDLLLYLFPYFLKKAMTQGLYKEYKNFEWNDGKVKGTIDVVNHINKNVPFRGNIAYRTREYSYDNKITQLIRHTIEHIKHSPLGRGVLQDVEVVKHIRLIQNSTPTYSLWNRRKVLLDNSKLIKHPYFTNYTILQQLCIRILRYEELKFGDDSDKVYGVLFDGAWLWEEYLNTLLQKVGFTHPRNRAVSNTHKQSVYLFDGNLYERFPDFYVAGKMVIDAKYKSLGSVIGREDMHQIISYLHVLSVPNASFAYPGKCGPTEYNTIGKLKGMGGEIGRFAIGIPQKCDTYKDFSAKMICQEGAFADEIGRLLNKSSL